MVAGSSSLGAAVALAGAVVLEAADLVESLALAASPPSTTQFSSDIIWEAVDLT